MYAALAILLIEIVLYNYIIISRTKAYITQEAYNSCFCN